MKRSGALIVAVSLFGVSALGAACGNAPRGDSPNAIVDRLAASDSRLQALFSPRAAAFRRAGVGDEDQGRLVSEGWRSTREKEFSHLGARLPETADNPTDIGVSRFERLRLRVSLAGAAAATAELDQGRVMYRAVLPSTDRVFASSATTLEELLLLHDERAPRAFRWNVHVSSGIAGVQARDGGLAFVDASGAPALMMPAPYAIDAHGARVALALDWNDGAHAFTVTLPDEPLAYPLIVDPAYETSVWFNVNGLLPPTRLSPIAYDSVRGETVFFGGAPGGTHGDTWVWNGSTWTQRTPATSPPSRRDHVLAFDTARGETVLFSGIGLSSLLGDTWVWNGTNWTQRFPGTTPAGRSSAVMVYDSARAETLLFGGNSTQTLNDTWTWNGVNWTLKSPAASPPVTLAASLAFDSVRNEAVLFGGYSTTATWVWTGSNWIQRMPATSPPLRAQSSFTFDPIRGESILFGGYDGNTNNRVGDTWAWNGTTWSQRAPSASPSPRSSVSAFDTARGQLIVFGGLGNTSYLNDTWTWNGTTWTQRSPLPSPAARGYSALAYDSVRNEVVLFGGCSDFTSNNWLGDTWVWNGSAWSVRMVTGPPARCAHGMAFDSARGETVLFGGRGAGFMGTADTWTWNGTAWTRKTPATSPSTRETHSLVFDTMRQEVVLFGGIFNGNTALSDTWVWNGTTWTERLPATHPDARGHYAFAFDATRGQSVLFGGYINAVLAAGFTDTWIWNGTTWSQSTTPVRPAGRFGPALAFDSAHGQSLLFGGGDFPSISYFDTWIWNGTAWVQRTSTISPAARYGSSLAYDSMRGRTVMFGGFGADNSALGDTFLHATIGGSCSTNAECLDSFCTDGVCCSASVCGACQTCAGTSPGRCAPVTNDEDPDTCAFRDGKSCSKTGDCRAALGVAATAATDCASGFLVDGVCCATNGCGMCETCDVAKKEIANHVGLCDPVKAGTDPGNSCSPADVATCKADGMCDGHGACRLYDNKTACGDNVCNENRASGRFCTGAGECIFDPGAHDCGAFACKSGSCRTTCVDITDCTALHHCESGDCVADRGAACDGDHTVTSPTGAPVDCKLYKCEGASCKTNCTSKTDCVGDADCSVDHACVAFLTAPSDPGGCSCSTHDQRLTWPGIPLCAGVALVLRVARGRARRRGHEPLSAPGGGGVGVPTLVALASSMTALTSFIGSTGLAMYKLKPSTSARVRSSFLAKAVSATAGIFSRASANVRIRRMREYPSSSGIPMSETITSGTKVSSSFKAARALSATRTSMPDASST